MSMTDCLLDTSSTAESYGVSADGSGNIHILGHTVGYRGIFDAKKLITTAHHEVSGTLWLYLKGIECHVVQSES